MSEKAVEYLSKQIENINNKLKEISDDIHCVDIEINTINDKITLIDNNTDKTEDMFISFGNEVFERNQNKLLKSKIDDLLKQKEIYQENYNPHTYNLHRKYGCGYRSSEKSRETGTHSAHNHNSCIFVVKM